MKYAVTSSFGNDSIALIQYMHENHKGEFFVLYNDTQWASKEWPKRVADLSMKCFEMGIQVIITQSEGMENLVRRKKGWPMPASNMQWCTQELKERPSLEEYQKHDETVVRLTVDSVSEDVPALADHMFPFNSKTNAKNKDGTFKHKTELEVVSGGDLIVVTGRRREESQNRRDLGKWQFNSAKHGGRDVYNPIVMFDEHDRDIYIRRFGVEPELGIESKFNIEPLPHSSKECEICVCFNKEEMSKLPLNAPVIDKIEAIEISMGHTKNSKPRTMFRPYRCGGAVGIRQVVYGWGHGKRGWKADHVPNEYKQTGEQCEIFESASDIAYDENTKEGREFARQCEGGYCGS